MIMTMAGITLALLSLLFLPTYLIGVGIFIVMYGFFFYAHQPALNALTGILTPYNQRGTVYGIYFFTSFGIGSISQLITGYLSDTYGLDTAFSLLTIFAVAALFLSFRLPEPKRSKENY